MNDSKNSPFGLSPSARRVLVLAVGVPLLIVVLAFTAGYASVAIKHGSTSVTYYGVLAGLLCFFALCSLGVWKLWPRGLEQEPVASSIRKARTLLYWMIGVGVVLGIFFALSGDMSGSNLFSNEPIGITTAVVGLIGWLVFTPLLTWLWWRSIDEHESVAYTDGALISAHVYIIGAPAWWIASRAGWLPEQDPMIVLVIVGTIWALVWLYRRYIS